MAVNGQKQLGRIGNDPDSGLWVNEFATFDAFMLAVAQQLGGGLDPNTGKPRDLPADKTDLHANISKAVGVARMQGGEPKSDKMTDEQVAEP